MALYTLTVDLLAETGSFETDLGKAARASDRAARAARQMQRELSDSFSQAARDAKVSMTSIQLDMSMLAKGFGALGGGLLLKRAINEIVSTQSELGQLNAVLKSTGAAVGFTSGQLVDMSDRMAKATTHTSGEIVKAQTRLLSYSSVVGENFTRALQLAIDQSARLGEDITQSAETIGKALEYPAEGISALTKQGFRFTQQQKELLKSLADTGRLAEAQAIVMGVMEESYAGAGQAARDTLGGALKSVKDQFDALLSSGADGNGVRAATAAINLFADNLNVLAAVAAPAAASLAVFYAGGKLAVGLRELSKLWAAHSLVAGRATVGLMGMTTATVRLTAAQTAGAIAARGLSAAYAAVGGAGGVAAAGIAAIGFGIYKAAEAASESRERFAGFTSSLTDIAEKSKEIKKDLLTGSSLREAMEGFGRMVVPMRDANAELDALREKLQRLYSDQRTSSRGDGGSALAYAGQIDATSKAIEKLQAKMKPAAQEMAALENALRQRMGPAFGDLQVAIERLRNDGNWEAFYKSIGPGATAAIDDLDRLEQRFKSLSSTISGGIASLPGQIARIGKSAKDIARLDVQDYLQAGIDKGAFKPGTAAWDAAIAQGTEYIKLRIQQESAEKAYASSRKATAAAEKAGAKDQKESADSIKRYNQQASLAAATMAGPLSEAIERQKQAESELSEALGKGRIERQAYNVLVQESQKALAASTAELDKKMGGPEVLLRGMGDELVLLGKLGKEREIYRRQLINERDMRQELLRAVEAAGSKEALAVAKGVDSYEAYEKAMLAAADAAAVMSVAVEEAAANVEAWVDVLVSGVSNASDALADFTADGMRDFKSLFAGMKNVAKQGLRDLYRQLLQQRLVIPIQTQITNGLSGQGGLSFQSLMGLMGGNGTAAGGRSVGGLGGLASGASSLAGSAGRSWGAPAAGGPGAGSLLGFGNNMAAFAGPAGKSSWLAGINWGGALTGGLMGMQGGDGLFGKGLSTLAGGFAGHAVSGAISAGMAAYKGGSGLMGALTGGLKSIGPAGWIGLGAFALDKVTGGGLFGTSWKTTGGASQFSIGAGGVSGVNETSESKKRSLFRGSKSRTNSTAMDDAALKSVRDLFDQIEKAMGQGAAALGIKVPPMIAGSFRQEFDKNGNLTKQFGQIAGRVYYEAEEAFAQRLAGENMLAVAKAYGSANEIERIAQKYRADAAKLNDVAGLTLAIQADIANATQLWNSSGDGTITKVVDRMGELARAGETMNEAYARLTGAARDYGALMADVSTQLLTGDLTQYQSQALTIERTYRQQMKAANDYAKALGLSGARAEDLAKIEALRAVNMGKLQAQIDKDKKAMQYGLSISDLSPLTDQEKLSEAMRELERAVSSGDSSAAQAAAQAALGFGRNLYASGNDFNGLYSQVTGLIDGMKVGNLDLDNGTSMGQLADVIEALPDNFSRAVFDLVVNNDGQAKTTAAVQESNALLAEQNKVLRELLTVTTKGVATTSSVALRESLNAR